MTGMTQTSGTSGTSWIRLDSPLGSLWLVADEHALREVRFTAPESTAPGACNSGAPLKGDALADAASTHPVLEQAAAELGEYFAGTRREFTVPLPGSKPGFHTQVRQTLRKIPFGQTWTYAQLAAAAGNPRAVRAAGTACATNPLPIIVPCHRIVRSDGQVGNYLGGADAKRWLLALEGGEPCAGPDPCAGPEPFASPR